MTETLRKLLFVLTAREKRRLAILIAVSVLAAALESLGVGVIFVFLKVISEPDTLGGIETLQALRGMLGEPPALLFLLLLLGGMLVFFLIRTAIVVLSYFLNLDLQRTTQRRLSNELFAGYLHEPYSLFTRTSAAAIVTTVTSNVAGTASHGIIGLVELLSAGMVALGILALLAVVRPFETLFGLVVFGVLGAFYWFVMRDHMTRWGQERVRTTEETYRVVTEAIRGIKTLKVIRGESRFVGIFKEFLDLQTSVLMKYSLSQKVPSVVLQFVVVVVIIVLVAFMLVSRQELSDAIPMLAMFGAAAFRIIPAVMQIVGHTQQLQYSRTDIERVYAAVLRHGKSEQRPRPAVGNGQAGQFDRIELDQISYAYEDADRAAVKDVSLHVRRGEFVAFTGLSGSGKTTTADILLGLLDPQSGEVRINGERLRGIDIRDRRIFGYVPQEPLVFDDTLRRNITLSAKEEAVDEKALQDAIRLSALDQVVDNLPHGIDSRLGDAGIRLSGGERQRIGLARALYLGAPVLVLDEPTSSLDAITEAQIVECLRSLRHKKTIIMIAHRFTAIKNADRIVFFEEGRVSAASTFDELSAKNDAFRQLLAHMKLTHDEQDLTSSVA